MKNNNRIEEWYVNFKWYINRKLYVLVIDIGINDDKFGCWFFMLYIIIVRKGVGWKL